MNKNEIQLQELYSETLEELAKIPVGRYNLNDTKKPWFVRLFQRNKGWLDVVHDKDGSVALSVLSDSETHNPHWGPAKYIGIHKVSDDLYNLKYYMRSALSLHLVWGYDKGTTVDLVEAMEFATQVLSIVRQKNILK